MNSTRNLEKRRVSPPKQRIRHDFPKPRKEEKEDNIDANRGREKEDHEEDNSSDDYVISSDSDMDSCPLFQSRKTNVLGLKRRKIYKKSSIIDDDDSVMVMCSKCLKYFLHSCCWIILVVIICLLLLGFLCFFECKWWYSYTIKELGKEMYYLNDSKAHPYKVEIVNERVFVWYTEKLKRYASRFSLFAQPMIQRAGKAKVHIKREECHIYNLIQYKDKYHRPNDPPPRNTSEEQIKNYLKACVLLGNMTEQSWELEVKFQKHIQEVFGVAF